MRALEVFAACAAHPRRRGNRIELLFAAVHESVHGTTRTWPNVRLEFRFQGKSGSPISGPSGPLMTLAA